MMIYMHVQIVKHILEHMPTHTSAARNMYPDREPPDLDDDMYTYDIYWYIYSYAFLHIQIPQMEEIGLNRPSPISSICGHVLFKTCDFDFFKVFFLDFHLFFFWKVGFAACSPRTAAPKTRLNPPKILLLHPTRRMLVMRCRWVFQQIFQKSVFFGVKGGIIDTLVRTWKQRIKHHMKHPWPVKISKSSGWNSGLRVARGSCRAKAPCRRAPSTTAKISNKFWTESPYISHTFSRESPSFCRSCHVCKRSPRHTKDRTRKSLDLEIQIF